MPLPSLESLTPALDRLTMDVLGDTIEYAANGADFVSLKADANYRDMERSFEATQVIQQDMTFAVLKVDVPVKPTSIVRVQLPKVPGKIFRPVNVRTDESGDEWEFELSEVPLA